MAQSEQHLPNGQTEDEAPPANFEQQSADIQAYWEAASQGSAKAPPNEGSPAILFTPLHVTLSDNKREADKSSTLLHARLERPCLLKSAVKEEGYRTFPKGAIVGIWTKPGMKAIRDNNLAGVQVWMKNGQEIGGQLVKFKDIGKGSDMVLFDIRWDPSEQKEKGKKLTVTADNRNKSLPDKLRSKRAEDAESLEGIPF